MIKVYPHALWFKWYYFFLFFVFEVFKEHSIFLSYYHNSTNQDMLDMTLGPVQKCQKIKLYKLAIAVIRYSEYSGGQN